MEKAYLHSKHQDFRGAFTHSPSCVSLKLLKCVLKSIWGLDVAVRSCSPEPPPAFAECLCNAAKIGPDDAFYTFWNILEPVQRPNTGIK